MLATYHISRVPIGIDLAEVNQLQDELINYNCFVRKPVQVLVRKQGVEKQSKFGSYKSSYGGTESS